MAELVRALQTDPLFLAQEVLRIPTLWWGAKKIILSIFNNKKVTIPSGHSMSKDWAAGIIAITWLLRYYPHAKVICTAPKDLQVKEIMFAEIEKQYVVLCEKMPWLFRPEWLTTKKLDFGPECFALGFTTKETNQMVGKFQGFKSPNILVIISEAQAVEPTVFKQIKGIMTSANSRVLEIGNPLLEFGDFYDHCTRPSMGYHVMKFSSLQSPNIIAGREIIPGMASLEWLNAFKEELGPNYEDDPEYQSRVLGEFPQQSAHAWIPLNMIKRAVRRVFNESELSEEEKSVRVGGLDTAREGPDETVHTVVAGRTQTRQDVFRKVLTPETVGWARKLIEESKLQALAIDIGYNPGVYDWLQYEKLPVMSINFGGESPHARFHNLGTFMWWCLRQAFMHEEISILDDPVLIYQLASRVVEMTPKGKLRLQKKKANMPKSPDRADALVLAWYARTQALGAVGSIWADAESDAAKISRTIERATERIPVSREEGIGPDYGTEDIGLVSGGTLDADSLGL